MATAATAMKEAQEKLNQQRADLEVEKVAIQEEKTRMRAELEAGWRELEEEKASMMKLGVEGDDVIELNAGGMRVATKRSTLTQAEGSLLASMFSGRWEDRLEKDERGAVFLDVDSWCMAELLSYLRHRKLAGPDDSVPLPAIPEDRTSRWEIFLTYFGLKSYLEPPRPPLCMDVLEDGVTWDSETSVLTRASTNPGLGSGVSSIPLKGTTVWRVCMSDHRVALGITSELNAVPNLHQRPSSYGWSQVYKREGGSHEEWEGFEVGDEVLLRYNMEMNKLEMHHYRLEKTYSMDLPRDCGSWHVFGVMWLSTQKLQMRWATEQEVEEGFP